MQVPVCIHTTWFLSSVFSVCFSVFSYFSLMFCCWASQLASCLCLLPVAASLVTETQFGGSTLSFNIKQLLMVSEHAGVCICCSNGSSVLKFYERVGVCHCVIQTAPQFIWVWSLLLHCLNFCSGFEGPLCMWVSAAVVQTSAQFLKGSEHAGVCHCCSDFCSVFEGIWRFGVSIAVVCRSRCIWILFLGTDTICFDFFQFGLATFHWSTLTSCYEAQTYNFYIFPRPSGGMDYRFTCQVWCKQVSGD